MGDSDHPRTEYHLEILGGGAHGDYVALTPFPAFNIGDTVVAHSFMTGGTMGIPAGQHLAVRRVQHTFN